MNYELTPNVERWPQRVYLPEEALRWPRGSRYSDDPLSLLRVENGLRWRTEAGVFEFCGWYTPPKDAPELPLHPRAQMPSYFTIQRFDDPFGGEGLRGRFLDTKPDTCREVPREDGPVGAEAALYRLMCIAEIEAVAKVSTHELQPEATP